MATPTDASKKNEIESLLRRATAGKVDRDLLLRLASGTRRSVKVSGKGISLSGQGLADLLLNVAPRLPVRNAETLSAEYGGMTGPALAGQVIRHAGRRSAAVGAVTGGLVSADWFLPPFWLMVPAEIVAETLIIACIEMKLIAELHEIYGTPITGDAAVRGAALLEAWSERRGVRVEDLASRRPGESFSKGARARLLQLVKRKLIARATRNLWTLAPMFIGAVTGAEVNRRATRDLGDAVVRDLASRT